MARRTRIRVIPLGILFIFVVFTVITGIRMATLDTSIVTTMTFQFPTLPNLQELGSPNYGQQAVAIDGKIVYSKNNIESSVMPIASTVKTILGLAVMEKKPFPLGEKGENITITNVDYTDYTGYIAVNGSTTPVVSGETYSEYDALALVFLASSNNMADTLARWAFGTIDAYHEYAIQMLANWGISDIAFGSDASGYDTTTTGSAASLALIAQKVMEQPVLAEIVNMKNYDVQHVGAISNTNKLLGIDRISGVKTGFNGDYASGYCLVSGYVEDDHTITAALLGAPTRNNSFADSQAMIEEVQAIYIPTTIVKAGDEVGYYDAWWTERTSIVAEEDVAMLGYDGLETFAELEMSDNSKQIATIVNGSLDLRIADGQKTAKVKTATEIKTSPNLWERFLRVFGWERN